jgi:hypothetical protein
MMYRGGAKGGCWADFSPTWFLMPRPLPTVVVCTARLASPSLCSLTSLVSLHSLCLSFEIVFPPPRHAGSSGHCHMAAQEPLVSWADAATAYPLLLMSHTTQPP